MTIVESSEGEASSSTPIDETTSASSKVKHTRSDRSEKLKTRHTLQLTVVKSALLRYVKGSKLFALAVVNAIQDRVSVVSRRTVDMSIACDGIVKEWFHGQADVNNVGLDNLFEQTFFRQLMIGVDDAIAPDQRVAGYHLRHPELAPSAERHLGDRNLYSSAAKRYETNFKNALRFDAERRIGTFVKRFAKLHHLTSTESFTMLYGLCGWRLPPRTDNGALPMRREVFDAIQEHRRVLGLGDNGEFNKRWLRSVACLEPLLRYNVLLNRFYELNGLKLFNVVPICTIKSHFITIDTYVLYGILREIGFIECNEAAFVETKEASWNALFRISQLQGRDCIFGCSIDTDGISMCTHFERPKEVPLEGSNRDVEAAQYTAEPNDVVIGCDPGRINIYYMATLLPDGTIKTFVLTRRQYYHDSGIFNATKHTNTWNLGIKTHLEALSTVSSKGISLHNHVAYLAVYVQHRDALWTEYTRPRWARQRLSLYGGKKRTFSNFFNNLQRVLRKAVPNCNIVVAYGAAKFAPGGRGELSVPTSRAYKECVTRVSTKVTAEFRSSKVDYKDDSVLQQIAVRGSGDFALRGLLWNPGEKEFISRDLNAAMNIRRNLLFRPAILNRRLATAKLVQSIVKRIKPRWT